MVCTILLLEMGTNCDIHCFNGHFLGKAGLVNFPFILIFSYPYRAS